MRGPIDKHVASLVWFTAILAAVSLGALVGDIRFHNHWMHLLAILGMVPLTAVFAVMACAIGIQLIAQKWPHAAAVRPNSAANRELALDRQAAAIAFDVLRLRQSGLEAVDKQIEHDVALLSRIGISVRLGGGENSTEPKIEIPANWKKLRPSEARQATSSLSTLVGCLVAKGQPMVTLVLSEMSAFDRYCSNLLQSAKAVFGKVVSQMKSEAQLIVDVPVALVAAMTALGFFQIPLTQSKSTASAEPRTVMQADRRRPSPVGIPVPTTA